VACRINVVFRRPITCGVAYAPATLEPITDEPRVLSRLDFPLHRLECLRAAATNRGRVVALRADADALLADVMADVVASNVVDADVHAPRNDSGGDTSSSSTSSSSGSSSGGGGGGSGDLLDNGASGATPLDIGCQLSTPQPINGGGGGGDTHNAGSSSSGGGDDKAPVGQTKVRPPASPRGRALLPKDLQCAGCILDKCVTLAAELEVNQ